MSALPTSFTYSIRTFHCNMVSSASRCALRLLYLDMAVSIEVYVEVKIRRLYLGTCWIVQYLIKSTQKCRYM
jgi:hypothetical protein